MIKNLKALTLKELQDKVEVLLSDIEQTSEINAERGMSAHCSGYSAYDAELISTHEMMKDLRQLQDRINELSDKKFFLTLFDETTRKAGQKFYFFAKNMDEAQKKVKAGYPNKWYGASITQEYTNNVMLFAVREAHTMKGKCSDIEKEARKGNLA